jgi:uridine kinase
MMLPPTPRVLALREIVAEVRALAPGGRVIVAVDGGGGTAPFADDLAAVFRETGVDTHRASVVDFHRPRADRTLFGPETPERFYRDAFDYSTLQRVLLDPFRMAGSTGFQTAAFDEVRDAPLVARWETAGPEAVLVIDGEFLLRPELRRMWNASILLVNAPERAVYEEDARPRDFATILVDESDPVVPVRVPRPESA